MILNVVIVILKNVLTKAISQIWVGLRTRLNVIIMADDRL